MGNSLKVLKTLVQLGSGVATVFACVESPLAQLAEIDSYELAVTSQTKENALAFIEEYSSSHLIADLIDSLPPAVANAVCADLANGPSTARRACEERPKVPGAEVAGNSTDVLAAPSQSAMEPTQPINKTMPAPATTNPIAVAPQTAGSAVGSQSETEAFATAAASTPTATETTATAVVPASTAFAVPEATTPPTPIKSRPMVYVGSESGTDIRVQPAEDSATIGTASSNAPLTVLGRYNYWLKVLVPDLNNRAGWVNMSGLQTDAGGVKVTPAAGATTPPVNPGTGTAAASEMQIGNNAEPAAAPSVMYSGASVEIAASAPVPASTAGPQLATATPPTPIKSRPVVYVSSEYGTDIRVQPVEGSATIGMASTNAPLTVLGRYSNWLKVLVPGLNNRAGWVNMSGLQVDASGVKVTPASALIAGP